MWRAAALSAAKPPPHHRECDEIAPPHADHWLPPSRRGGAAGITSSRRRPRAVGCSTLNLSQKGRQVLWAGLKRSESSEVAAAAPDIPRRGLRSKKVRARASMCFRSTPKPRPTMAARRRNDLQSFFQTEPRRLCASVYRHAARLNRPGPFVDLGGDEFGKVFRASALRRCNILTNRFEAFTDERQIEGGA